ncbi:ABC transporter permease [Wenzhouxiangella sp. AB-CW3]|uniref:ABC transporter permease n=1 Tax=Wenzhouxiangella sp. AB-CW3 TaxID=2771012 RepID=UPI00168B6E56|nr:ABC transporter permease [Wenzhouxiangella sp. AB-CW3]QOC24116.1 ABC transporter permease [Wenzhouxiangella sp. AB-CW3]
MPTLHRKLIRDLGEMKGQIAAIAVVMAAGVMTLVLAVSSLDSIRLSKDRFYTDYQFADLFASLTRAPDTLVGRLGEIEGINLVETRVVAPVRLEVPEFVDPVRGHVLSIPDGRQPLLNRLYLAAGSLPESGRSDQVVISQPFAEAHDLNVGDELRIIIRGRYERLRVSGVALSPEFVYQVAPTDLLPDYERYAVMWMNRRALANAFGMDGAFNSVVASVQAGADQRDVIDRMDRLLAPYGGIGAHDREDVMSHRILIEEIAQLEVMTIVLPGVFMGVSAFLLSVLMGRIVTTQRQQIAVIKAFGYSDGDLAVHYALLTGMIVAVGVALGLVLGAWAGEGMAALYAEYFRFPETITRMQGRVVALAILVSAAAAGLGTFRAVHQAVRLPPAEAMRPPAPAEFHQSWFDRSAAGRWLAQTTRMVLRNVSRHPVKASLTVAGIALSGALLLLGHYQFGSVKHLVELQYRDVMKMDVHVTFVEPTSLGVLNEIRALPGVHYVEGYRNVPVRLANGHMSERTAISGLPAQPQLRGLIDSQYRSIRLPPDGLFLTRYLAEELGLALGDRVEVEVLEGQRQVIDLPLAGVIDEPLGLSGYMHIEALNTLMRESPAVSGAWLLIDRDQRQALFDRLWDASRVAGISQISEAEDGLREYMEDTVLAMMAILLLLAGSITFALVYNNARIAFAERSRELATLRVLGFSRGQVGWVLIGEIALLTLAAIPLAWLLGTGFAWLLSLAFQMDMMRVPFHITHQSYAFAAAGVVVASALSVVLIVRRLATLDMVSALKSIE